MQSFAWSCFEQQAGLDDLLRSLPTLISACICESTMALCMGPACYLRQMDSWPDAIPGSSLKSISFGVIEAAHAKCILAPYLERKTGDFLMQ